MVAINEIRWVVSLIDWDETRILRGRGIGPWLKPGAWGCENWGLQLSRARRVSPTVMTP